MYSERIFRGQHHHLLPLRGEMQDNSHHHICQETAMRGTLTWKAFPSVANFTIDQPAHRRGREAAQFCSGVRLSRFFGELVVLWCSEFFSGSTQNK